MIINAKDMIGINLARVNHPNARVIPEKTKTPPQ
jgi:hypothetical protein